MAAQIRVATSIKEAEGAWKFLYQQYREAGYIPENQHGIHTHPAALALDSATIVAYQNNEVIGTMTCMADMDNLPLMDLYRDEIDQLSCRSRVIEIGLFAISKDHSKAIDVLMDIMVYAYYAAWHFHCGEMICGVPPARQDLYRRLLGFYPAGDLKVYEHLNRAPVLMMHANVPETCRNSTLYRGIQRFEERPINTDLFDSRCRFTPESLSGTILGDWITHQESHHAHDQDRRRLGKRNRYAQENA